MASVPPPFYLLQILRMRETYHLHPKMISTAIISNKPPRLSKKVVDGNQQGNIKKVTRTPLSMLKLEHLDFIYKFAQRSFSFISYEFTVPVTNKEETLQNVTREYSWLEDIITGVMDCERQPFGDAGANSISHGIILRPQPGDYIELQYQLSVSKNSIREASIRIKHIDSDQRRILGVFDLVLGGADIVKSEKGEAAYEKIAVLRKEGTPHAYIALLQ
jgi:hypothetical protein